MDHSQLIIACRNNIRSAQQELYQQFAPKLMTVCLRYSHDEEAARDLLHDGFIQVFTQIDSYSGKGSFEGWMKRIIVNMAMQNYRKEKKKELFLENYKHEQIEEGEIDDTFDIEGVSREDVLKMIQELPTGYQTVFNLYIFEDMSYKEIAQQLGISEVSSRSQFSRAKAMLQKKVAEIREKKI